MSESNISKRPLMAISRRSKRGRKLKDGSDYSVNYKLSFGPSGWRVYDVIVEGASLVNNYRAQVKSRLTNCCKRFGRRIAV
jgi:hypothetical protein